MIAALDEKDREVDENGSPENPENAGDVGELESGGEDHVSNDETEPAEIVEIKLLKLHLELARENRLALEIKERINANSSFESRTERDLRGLLPKMSDRDEDVVSFFSAFERTLELYNVDCSSYCRLLPSCLSAKASKVYAKLSLEQSKHYVTVKREILASFKLDAASYIQKFRSAKRCGSES